MLRHLVGAIEADLRVLELRLRGHLLRLRRGEVRFGLADLIRDLPLLEPERGGAFRDLRGRALGASRVERLLLFELAPVEHADHLTGLDLVAFLDGELLDAPGNLRADDHVVGGDDAGEDQGHRSRAEVPVVRATGNEDGENQRSDDAFHVESNNCIKQLFESSSGGQTSVMPRVGVRPR